MAASGLDCLRIVLSSKQNSHETEVNFNHFKKKQRLWYWLQDFDKCCLGLFLQRVVNSKKVWKTQFFRESEDFFCRESWDKNFSGNKK